MAENPASPKKLSNTVYTIETILKAIFIPMSIINAPFTIIVAFLTSLVGLFRVCKMPQFNKEYLQKVLSNNHGQNLLYLIMGSMGYVNFLFYAPIIVFFLFGIVQYINMNFKDTRFQKYLDLIRNNKFYVYEGRCKIEIVYFFYMLFSLPLDLMGRLLKVFLVGQYLLVKYRLSNEMRFAAQEVNRMIEEKTLAIGFVNNAYKKLAGWIYSYANSNPGASS